jgi:type II secretory pathway pseudopilin PulG
MFQNQIGNNKGITIVEILVIIAIIGIAFGSLLGLSALSLRVSTSIKETSRANSLAQETLEAVRNFRDGIPWNNDDPENKYDGLGVITTGTAYHPEKSTDTPPKWQLIQGEETVNGFTRKVVFENVQRDGNDNIVDSGGTNDPDTKKVTVTVTWKNKEVKIVTYLTNWKQ